MSKNPFINAVIASAYIVLVVSVIFYGSHMFENGEPETILIPMAMLSLFVLSAAIMGYVFLFQPVQLLLAGNKKEAVKLFLQTAAIFAVITLGVFGVALIR